MRLRDASVAFLPMMLGVLKRLGKVGLSCTSEGSHIALHRQGRFIVVPRHKEIAPGTLLTIIRDAGLTREQFLELVGT